MEEVRQNKMAVASVKKLFWKLGLPMIISMVLQALYNVVDSVFVANMQGSGALANEALTIAFPVQIMIIAVSVGTGVGLNALLSKNLGERNTEKVNAVAGNGIFLCLIIYAVFLLFGLFLSDWFIGLFSTNADVIKMGAASYLRLFFSRFDRFCGIRKVFASHGQNYVFYDCADFGRGNEYRFGLRFYIPVGVRRRRRGVGDYHRAVRFAFYRNGVALLP